MISQTTQETSKQVYVGQKQPFLSPGASRHSDAATRQAAGGRTTDVSMMMVGELSSIKEDPVGAASRINATNRGGGGLTHEDSIIENDQPSMMLPKVGRQPVHDYKQQQQQPLADNEKNNMGVTGDSFADSIMSNHYQNK